MSMLPRVYAPTRPRYYKFRQMEFFAERGIIRKLDKHTGEYRAIGRRQFLEQASTWSAAAKRRQYSDERMELLRLVEAMVACAKEAKRQGDPFAPGVTREMMSRRPQSILVPGAVSRAPGERVELVIPGRDYSQVKPESHGYAAGQAHVLTPRC